MDKAAGSLRRSEQLREVIEERIATGHYRPGMRLDETELATEFEVSRTPVREAFMQLASAGLLDLRPRRGAMVQEVSPQKLFEMFEVMAELEAMCARLAARRLTDADHQNLLSAHQACQSTKEANEPDAFYRINEQFHQVLYACSHNSFLIETATALQRRLSAYRRLQLRVRDRVRTSHDEHAAIVAAIVAGEGEQAAELVRQHVSVQGERFNDLMASVASY